MKKVLAAIGMFLYIYLLVYLLIFYFYYGYEIVKSDINNLINYTVFRDSLLFIIIDILLLIYISYNFTVKNIKVPFKIKNKFNAIVSFVMTVGPFAHFIHNVIISVICIISFIVFLNFIGLLILIEIFTNKMKNVDEPIQ